MTIKASSTTKSNSSRSINTNQNTHDSTDIKTYPCPHCQKQTAWLDNPNKPFCSHRCKLIDFGAWANEDYRMPAEDTPFSSDFN